MTVVKVLQVVVRTHLDLPTPSPAAIMKSSWIILAVVIGLAFADDDHGEAAKSFTEESFNSEIAAKAHFVMFFAPW